MLYHRSGLIRMRWRIRWPLMDWLSQWRSPRFWQTVFKLSSWFNQLLDTAVLVPGPGVRLWARVTKTEDWCDPLLAFPHSLLVDIDLIKDPWRLDWRTRLGPKRWRRFWWRPHLLLLNSDGREAAILSQRWIAIVLVGGSLVCYVNIAWFVNLRFLIWKWRILCSPAQFVF